MVLTPVEWIVIAILVIVFVIMGPKKIPELARALGQARNEFTKGVAEYQRAAAAGGNSTEEPARAHRETATLMETARRLGISTEGKTDEDISQEIVRKAQTQK